MALKSQLKSYTFKIVVEEDAFADGTRAYHVYIPALKGCRSWGYTIEEALENLEVTAKLWLEEFIAQGKPIPQEAESKSGPWITVNLAC